MKRVVHLMPSSAKILKAMGENLRMARLRRKISAQQVAERANISRSTLWMMEKGSPAVAIGAYTQVLFVLGMENDLLKVGADDVLGKQLQDLKLTVKSRAPKKSRE
jgi:transcriptional regulator with XRE-family HTH domain